MATAQATSNAITLRGSVAIVTEFFDYAINSILYQRGIYPPESFDAKTEYGLRMQITQDKGLEAYLKNVLKQMEHWLLNKALQKMVLVVTNVETHKVQERWVFNLETDGAATLDGQGAQERDVKDVRKEIQAVIRQITASVTFLPLLEDPCTFDLLLYTDADAEVPTTWEESEPKYITNAAEVRLRSFTTKIHKVDAMVSYQMD